VRQHKPLRSPKSLEFESFNVHLDEGAWSSCAAVRQLQVVKSLDQDLLARETGFVEEVDGHDCRIPYSMRLEANDCATRRITEREGHDIHNVPQRVRGEVVKKVVPVRRDWFECQDSRVDTPRGHAQGHRVEAEAGPDVKCE